MSLKLHSLQVKGPEKYDNYSELRGTVTLRDDNDGEQVVKLSAAAISRLLAVIAKEVATNAAAMARDVPSAFYEAVAVGELVEAAGTLPPLQTKMPQPPHATCLADLQSPGDFDRDAM